MLRLTLYTPFRVSLHQFARCATAAVHMVRWAQHEWYDGRSTRYTTPATSSAIRRVRNKITKERCGQYVILALRVGNDGTSRPLEWDNSIVLDYTAS